MAYVKFHVKTEGSKRNLREHLVTDRLAVEELTLGATSYDLDGNPVGGIAFNASNAVTANNVQTLTNKVINSLDNTITIDIGSLTKGAKAEVLESHLNLVYQPKNLLALGSQIDFPLDYDTLSVTSSESAKGIFLDSRNLVIKGANGMPIPDGIGGSVVGRLEESRGSSLQGSIATKTVSNTVIGSQTDFLTKCVAGQVLRVWKEATHEMLLLGTIDSIYSDTVLFLTADTSKFTGSLPAYTLFTGLITTRSNSTIVAVDNTTGMSVGDAIGYIDISGNYPMYRPIGTISIVDSATRVTLSAHAARVVTGVASYKKVAAAVTVANLPQDIVGVDTQLSTDLAPGDTVVLATPLWNEHKVVGVVKTATATELRLEDTGAYEIIPDIPLVRYVGTISNILAEPTIIRGVGTDFTSALVGKVLTIVQPLGSTTVGTVASVASLTELTLESATTPFASTFYYRRVTGSVTSRTTLTEVIGVGTDFDNTTDAGKYLYIAHGSKSLLIGMIASVTDPLALTLVANAVQDFVSQSYYKLNLALKFYDSNGNDYTFTAETPIDILYTEIVDYFDRPVEADTVNLGFLEQKAVFPELDATLTNKTISSENIAVQNTSGIALSSTVVTDLTRYALGTDGNQLYHTAVGRNVTGFIANGYSNKLIGIASPIGTNSALNEGLLNTGTAFDGSGHENYRIMFRDPTTNALNTTVYGELKWDSVLPPPAVQFPWGVSIVAVTSSAIVTTSVDLRSYAKAGGVIYAYNNLSSTSEYLGTVSSVDASSITLVANAAFACSSPLITYYDIGAIMARTNTTTVQGFGIDFRNYLVPGSVITCTQYGNTFILGTVNTVSDTSLTLLALPTSAWDGAFSHQSQAIISYKKYTDNTAYSFTSTAVNFVYADIITSVGKVNTLTVGAGSLTNNAIYEVMQHIPRMVHSIKEIAALSTSSIITSTLAGYNLQASSGIMAPASLQRGIVRGTVPLRNKTTGAPVSDGIGGNVYSTITVDNTVLAGTVTVANRFNMVTIAGGISLYASLVGQTLYSCKPEEADLLRTLGVVQSIDTSNQFTLSSYNYEGGMVSNPLFTKAVGTVSAQGPDYDVVGSGTRFLSYCQKPCDLYAVNGTDMQFLGEVEITASDTLLTLHDPAPFAVNASYVYKKLLGTISASVISNDVTGVNSNFLDDYYTGDPVFAIVAGTVISIGTVATVTSNTLIVLGALSTTDVTSGDHYNRLAGTITTKVATSAVTGAGTDFYSIYGLRKNLYYSNLGVMTDLGRVSYATDYVNLTLEALATATLSVPTDFYTLLQGTVTTAIDSTTITGVGTKFIQDLGAYRDIAVVSGGVLTPVGWVIQIIDDEHAVLQANALVAEVGATAYRKERGQITSSVSSKDIQGSGGSELQTFGHTDYVNVLVNNHITTPGMIKSVDNALQLTLWNLSTRTVISADLYKSISMSGTSIQDRKHVKGLNTDFTTLAALDYLTVFVPDFGNQTLGIIASVSDATNLYLTENTQYLAACSGYTAYKTVITLYYRNHSGLSYSFATSTLIEFLVARVTDLTCSDIDESLEVITSAQGGTKNYMAGGSISKNDVCYIDTDRKAYKAENTITDINIKRLVVASTAVSEGSYGDFYYLPGSSIVATTNLFQVADIGKEVYLALNGQVTTTLPALDGANRVMLGYVDSLTTWELMQQLYLEHVIL